MRVRHHIYGLPLELVWQVSSLNLSCVRHWHWHKHVLLRLLLRLVLRGECGGGSSNIRAAVGRLFSDPQGRSRDRDDPKHICQDKPCDASVEGHGTVADEVVEIKDDVDELDEEHEEEEESDKVRQEFGCRVLATSRGRTFDVSGISR